MRYLIDPNGAVKLARMYEPFGQVLMQVGTGDPTYGYLGAQFDRISGLLYINGAYYDPATGWFLSPSSGGSNPYVPLGGAALAPILILALVGRRKKGKIWTGWLVVALMVSAGLTMAACGGQPTPSNPPSTATAHPIMSPPAPAPTSIPSPTQTPLPAVPPPSPTPTCTPTSSPTALPAGVPTPPDGWRWQLAPLDSPGTLFTITHYNTTLESRHPIQSGEAGLAPQGLGLQRTVSRDFLSRVLVQGSGYLDLGTTGDYNGYFGYNYKSGRTLETAEFLRTDCALGANNCVRSMETGATSMSQSDREATGLAIFGNSPAGAGTGTVVYIEQMNRQIRINDTGGAVGKYQIDVYTGIEGSPDDTQFTTVLHSKVSHG